MTAAQEGIARGVDGGHALSGQADASNGTVSKNTHARCSAAESLTQSLGMLLFHTCSRHLCKVLEAECCDAFSCWRFQRLLHYGRGALCKHDFKVRIQVSIKCKYTCAYVISCYSRLMVPLPQSR